MTIEWQENPSKKPMTWNEAIEYAKSLGNGWRLPTKEELKKAYDNKVEGFKPTYYWSLSQHDESIDVAGSIEFHYGCVSNVLKTYYYYVRCVRDIKEEAVRESFWKIRDLVQVQEKSSLKDDYNLGLYNGMELCLALLEKREPKYKDLNPTPKQTIHRYRIDVLQNSKREITGMKYELEENGNWIQYNDVRNLIEKQEYILSELKKLLDEIK